MLERLRSLFHESFTQFLSEEADNILNGVSERNLCARLAPILERRAHDSGIEGYKADVEYNRNLNGKVKTIVNAQTEVVSITCDIILHSRGQIPVKDNLIAVEMKRIEHPQSDKDSDRIRLQALTKKSYDDVWAYDGKSLPEHVCGYEIGYFAELDVRSRKFLLEEYVLGELVATNELTF